MNLKTKFSPTKEKVDKLLVDKKFVTAEHVAVDVHCDKLSDEVASQWTELNWSSVISVA